MIAKQNLEKEVKSIDQQFKPYLKMEKSIRIEYEIIKKMLANIDDEKGIIQSEAFTILFTSLSEEIKQLSIFELLSYKLWLNDSFPASVRQKTRFFTIVFDWIVKFEMRVGKLCNYSDQFGLITEFVKANAKTCFQRVILLHEVYDDLRQLIPGTFWQEKTVHDIIQPIEDQQDVTQQDAVSIIEFMQEVVFYNAIVLQLHGSNSEKPKEQLYYNKNLSELCIKNYVTLVLNCIKLLLTTSNFDSTVQINLTKVALKFLHRQLPPEQTIKIIKSLMVKTSKAVRYALVVEYVQFYEFLEQSSNYPVIQQLENSVYFRELIIGRKSVQEAQIIKHDISCVEKPFNVKARVKERLYFSNQTDEECILKLELYIDSGDISFKMLWFDEKQSKEVCYYEENRTTDTRIQLRLKYRGLYAIQFDNTYSWINGKSLLFKMDTFYKVQSQESNIQDKLATK